MKKKCTLSTMLSLIVVVITVIAFGGMTVWADPEPASYDLSPDTYTLTNSGYSDITFSFDSVNYGTVIKEGKEELATDLEFRFYSGTLSCGDNQINFFVDRTTHMYTSNGQVYMSLKQYSNDPFTISVYIDPAAYRSAPAGIYTGTLDYTSEWRCGANGTVDGDPGSVELTLVIPDANENVFEHGTRDNISWSFDRSGTLTISGTGAMGDYKRNDAPWDSCKEEITKVIIESGITSVGENAFWHYDSMKNVSLPDGLTSIGFESFYDCDVLETVSMPDSITEIGQNAFRASVNLKLDTLPASLNSIGRNAFAHCYAIESITIPGSLEKIEDYAFSCCYGLTDVVISDGVKTIGSGAFSTCRKMATLTIADSVELIDKNAFEFAGITTLDLPANLKVISGYAFQNCKNLVSVSFPSGLTTIGSRAFDDCALTSVDIPGSVTDFGDYAFVSCSDLKSVTLHEGLTTIPACVFYKCYSLKTLNIPNSVTYIGEDAFIGCTGLEKFTCLANPDNLTWNDSNRDDFKYNGSTICEVRKDYLDKYLANFAHVNVTFTGTQVSMGIGDHLYGYTVSLEGDIGVNFYMKFDNVDALEDDAKMVFTIKSLDGKHTKTQTVYVKPQADTSLPYAKVNNSYYVFKCSVNAKEMTSIITAQITNGNDQGDAYQYSVQEYAAYILSNPTLYPGEQELVKAMLNYGAYSQIYFNYNTDNLANSFMAPEDCDVSSVTASSLPAIPIFSNQLLLTGNGIITLDGVSLALESETVMNLYFNGDLDGVYFMCNGKRLAATTTSDGSVKVAVTGIPAQNIDNVYSVELYLNDSKIGAFEYSPLKYCYNVLNRELTPERTAELKDCVRALYLFNQQADAYLSH